MDNALHDYAQFGNLERVKKLVEGGVNIDETNDDGDTALILAIAYGKFEIAVYLVEHGANVAHTDDDGMTALHEACAKGNLPTMKCLLGHGARITDRSVDGKTALFYASGFVEAIQYLLSSEGGATITETDNAGNTPLLFAAGPDCLMTTVQWLLEHGGAQITDTNNEGDTVWTIGNSMYSLRGMLIRAYAKSADGEYVSIGGEYVPTEEIVPNGDIMTLTAMLRVMVLHGGPPESLTNDLAPPFQQIVQGGARLRARLPAYLVQRRALLDAHCPLLPPLRDLVHGYEEPTTTDELWATGLGALLQRARRSRPERGMSPERRSARLRQKRQ
jgi:hypothetical protein